MADISSYLAAILAAVYGEDVRGSIHDAIEIINDVSEVILVLGTDVTGPTSSSTGFFEDSLYLNTDTYELWKCVGTDSWASQGILKGADGSPGAPGADGNKWYRGTGISGKATNPTVYSGSGIALANPNDFYLNPSEGAVYHCVTGGDASTATWSYDFTMTGGGGGSIVTWNQIQTSTGATKIAEIDIDGTTTNVYAPSGGGGGSTLSGLSDVTITSASNGQVLTYDNANSKWVNQTPSQGGHTMIPVVNDIATVQALTDGDDNYVVNAYTAKRWSNVDRITIYTTLAQSKDTIGAWNDNWQEEVTPDRTGWIWDKRLYKVLQTNGIDFDIKFNPDKSENVSLAGWRCDDEWYVAVPSPTGNPKEQGMFEESGGVYTLTNDTSVQVGKTYYWGGGCVAIKANSAVQHANGIVVSVVLDFKRTELVPATILT